MAPASKPLRTSTTQLTLRIRSDGSTTRNQKRLIDQAIDQCDAEEENGDEQVPELVYSDAEGSDKDHDEIPALESFPSDDRDHPDSKLTNFVRAPASAIYDMEQGKCTTFCDDVLRAVKETDQILQLCQIRRGPVVPDPKIMEQWATTDGGASSAFNRHEAIDRWDSFSKQKNVNAYRLMVFMRKAGYFLYHCELNTEKFTHVIGLFTEQDANHTKFDLPPVPIWGTKRMAKIFQRYMANQDGLSNEHIFTAAVYTTWTTGLSYLSTDLVRMHEDAHFWYKQHIRDADINRRHRIMLKVDGSFRRGDVTHMQAYIELGAIMRDYWGGYCAFKRVEISDEQIKIRHAIMHNPPANYHSYVPVAAEATSLDYYGDWPGQMERQIEESLVRAAQDEGPPDWVAGPEGNIVTVDDEVAIKIK